ncbi:MAG: leucine-rich repeat-containing protein kinase family protein, partial [Stenotrophomonas sp.]
LAGARHVRLTGLGLRQFPRQLFCLANSLEVLDLSGNQLASLPDDLHRLHRLRILFASDNPFTELPIALGQCTLLEMVGFKACRIEHVPAQSLPPQLRWLILTDNRIEQLPASLGQRPRLQKLMLSCNRLSDLPDLSACHRLELLRLAGNRLREVPASLLTLPALAWLALAGNPFSAASEQAVLDDSSQPVMPWHVLEMAELLGEGASGWIHRAIHKGEATPVALKRFKAAATSDGTPQSELAAGLHAGRHRHLLTPLARVDGVPGNGLAVALPLLDGHYRPLAGPPSFASCTRDVYADDLHLSQAQAEQLLQGIHAAVQHLHARGIVHGDLYAHNILCNPASGHALLSDFGAAMLTDGLPAATVERLQAIEWRAFAHLQDEIRLRTASQPTAR